MIRALGFCLLLGFTSGCSRSGNKETDHVPQPTADVSGVTAEQVAALAHSHNTFAFDLYAKLRAQPGNLAFSSYSIATALSMVSSGARGQTLDQILAALRTSLPPEQLHPASAALIHALFHSGPQPRPYRIHIAHAIWTQSGAPLDAGFTAGLASHYDAAAHAIDFTKASDAARTINRWVADQTSNRIGDLVNPGMFDPLTRFVLTNAIYFNGQWEDTFDKAATSDRPFHLTVEQTAQVPTMKQATYTRFHKGEGFTAITLPYKGQELAMVLLLPQAVDGLSGLEARLSEGSTWAWLDDPAGLQSVDVELPRFRVDASFDLVETLKALGITLAFDSTQADFSGTGASVFISDAVHRTYVDVNERGTEAAAATAFVMTGAADLESPPVFHADRPFLFAIRHAKTGCLLFLGRVVDPRG